MWGIFLAGLLWLGVGQVEPDATVILHATILYDGNHDGIEEGVGAGRLVGLYSGQDGSLLQTDKTDPNSHVVFAMEDGTYIVEAYVPSTRLFFQWVCQGSFYVPINRTVEIHCIERFIIQLPFVIASAAKE